jgi:DNA-binding HxlR family transcriptional regulator
MTAVAGMRLRPSAFWVMPTAGDSSVSNQELPPCGCLSPGTVDAASCYCSVEDLLRIIRRRYSLAVLSAIQARGSARYHDVASALPSISSSTLAETLQALTAAGLVSRSQHSSDRPHTIYVLQPSGEKLLSRLHRLLTELGD